MSSVTTIADDGTALPVGDLPVAFTHEGNFIATSTVEYIGNTYVQTYTNDGANVTSISRWEKQ